MRGVESIRRVGLSLAVLWLAASVVAGEVSAERIYRERRLMRGDTNVRHVQPIDDASWIWSADDAEMARTMGETPTEVKDRDVHVFAFRRDFLVNEGDDPLVIDVSADERFLLTCDGEFVARGPNYGAVENWQYQSYRLKLKPGRHELRAVVTRLGGHAPLAVLSYRGGFVLKAEGTYDGRLTTGKATWQVGRIGGIEPAGADNNVWGAGSQFVITGSGPFAAEPREWREAVVVRGPIPNDERSMTGRRILGWMLFPSQLPDQIEEVVRPGKFVAATHDAEWRKNHVYTEAETAAPEVAEFNRLLKGETIRIAAHTRLQLAWNLGRYYCAYPQLTLGGGKGARVAWSWAESTRNASDKRKGDRCEIVGKYLDGYGDTFVSDGRERGVFSAPWFRCGLWCRLDVETGDEPLEIGDFKVIETRYPLEMESEFASPDDPSLKDIRRICARAMQMCSHESLFDCPYYEQQMYPGDTRVQLLVLTALSRDDRMIRRAIEMYDLATRDDGQCPFRWPTRRQQEGLTYTLCYLCMYGDYAMNHADREWLRARLPGMRRSLSGCELYENAEGLLEHTPGWNFMDWPAGWPLGTIPGSDYGCEANAFVNLFWLMALQSAVTTERALGNELQARYWEEKAARLKPKIVEKFWVEERGMLADTLTKRTFSEHVQALAILTDVLPRERRERCFEQLVMAGDLSRTTVYFSYYLFEAYFRMGRADLFQKRLDLWRGYVEKGLTTLSEMPDLPTHEGRSDCHGWGAHPIWFMQTGFAGISSAAPFFAEVRVAPQPGSFGRITARHPHPQGWIELELAFDGGKASGKVNTPVPGRFVFGGKEVPLKAGENFIGK